MDTMTIWVLSGVAIHIYFYAFHMKALGDGFGVMVCLLILPIAALLGPIVGIVYAACAFFLDEPKLK